MFLIDLATSLSQLADSLPLAHDIGYPHQDPAPKPKASGGASPILIGGGVVMTLGLAGALFWVRERTRRADAEVDAPEA